MSFDLFRTYFKHRLTAHMCFATSAAMGMSYYICRQKPDSQAIDSLIAIFAPYTYLGWYVGIFFARSFQRLCA